MNTFSYGVSSIFNLLGINFSPNMDRSIFHLGKAGILCVVFAVGALVLSMLYEDTFAHLPISSITPARKWKYPACGSEMPVSALFCTSCVAKRSKELCCTSYGRTLENGAAFCSYCGVPVIRREASSAKEYGKNCPSCGYTVSMDSTFCPSCRYNFSSPSKLLETLAKPNNDDLS